MNPTNQSYFDGSILSYIGYSLLTAFVTIITLGLGTPWAICIMLEWKISHTVIDGHRLYFDGTGSQLIGSWIKWIFLIIITLGIYSFWVEIKYQDWVTRHTHHLN